jgi:hypothetical protein
MTIHPEIITLWSRVHADAKLGTLAMQVSRHVIVAWLSIARTRLDV